LSFIRRQENRFDIPGSIPQYLIIMKRATRKYPLILLAFALAAATPGDILKRYDMDPRQLQTVYQCIKAANFREVRDFSAVTTEGGRYRFQSEKRASIVYFKSKQLDELRTAIGGDEVFTALLRNAACYGVFIETRPMKDADGKENAYSIFDAHVVVIEHGSGADEITVVCMADRT